MLLKLGENLWESHSKKYSKIDLMEPQIIEEGLSLETIIQNEEQQPSIIISYPNYEGTDDDVIINGMRYELRYIGRTWDLNTNSWDGEFCMRHGKEYTHWWYQKRNDWIGRQLTGSPNVVSECGYTYVHVRVEDVNLDK